MTLLDRHWRFTVEDFHRMGKAGVLPQDQGGVELIQGQLIDMHPPMPHLFTVDDFMKLAEVGILNEDDPVELIEGELIERAPTGSRHFAAVNYLTKELVLQVGSAGIVSIQNPVQLGERSMPEPDVVVLSAAPDGYRDRLPGPENVLLLVEVADSSLVYDTRTKLQLYARQRIPEYWLFDLVRSRLEVFREPRVDRFDFHQTLEGNDEAVALALPGVRIRVSDVTG